MDVKLHANATTTPRTRAYIQSSPLSVARLAAELGISERTVRRWKDRESTSDGSHRPKRLMISLSDVEERLVLELRRDLVLPLDDLVEVMQRCCRAELSRSAIHRCLKRHGVSARAASPEPAPPQPFEPATVGFIHIDLKHLTRLDGRPAYVFVAIDRATRFVHIEIVERRDAETIAACLDRFIERFPHPVHTILTDNGSEFTDRFGDARWRSRSKGTGSHAFDRCCASHGIEHRLTKPFHPQTNGMVERFNRRLAEEIARKPAAGTNRGYNKFRSHAERNAYLLAFVEAYNRTRLRCLQWRAPAEILNNLPGHNTKAGIQCRRDGQVGAARPARFPAVLSGGEGNGSRLPPG